MGTLKEGGAPAADSGSSAMLSGWLRPWRGRSLVLLLSFLLWALFATLVPGSLQQLDERSTDLVWRATALAQPERRVVVVDIDDASLNAVGPWPWPRPVLAELTRQLDRQGVGLKLFDMVFPDAREGTAEFTRALVANDATSPSVLAQVFAVRNETTLKIGQPAGAVSGMGCQPVSMSAQGLVANAADFPPRVGHITPTLDQDGAVRRVPSLICFGGRAYPTLAVAGLMAVQGRSSSAPELTVVPGAGAWSPEWVLSFQALPGVTAGLDGKGQLRVPYRQARSAYLSISAVDVLREKVPQGLLRGAWVVVGASAFGLSDAVPTALGGAVSGAEVHAQILTALVDGVIPFTPRAAGLLQFVFVLVFVGLLLWLVSGPSLQQRQRVVLLPLVALLAACLAYCLHAFALIQANWYVGWASPALAVFVVGSGLGLGEHTRSQVEKSRLFRNLSSYVPSSVAEKIALTLPSSDIEAQRSDVTILAADVRNFSAYCEARSPEDAARVLHRFYKTASEIVASHGGVVEEMVGDSLLAVFNGPLACVGHPEQALTAAREIWLRCGEELPNTTGQGLEPLGISIGIESGMALVGSFGAAGRRVHTVLGQTVTIALRLRDLTADLAYPILVGHGTAQRIPTKLNDLDSSLKPLGVFLLPGLRHSGKIFTLLHLLQPNGPAEQRTLDYLHQQHIAA